MEKFDVVVIGGGPGGYVCAIRAAQIGLSTALVEKEHLGGVCLNWGCIPTKALLRSAEIKHLVEDAERFGVSIKGDVSIDLEGMVKRSRDVSGKLAGGIKHLLKKNNVKVFEGMASFKDAHHLHIQHAQNASITVHSKHIVIATGAHSRTLPHIDKALIESGDVWLAKHAMIPARMPKKLMIVGSGAIGIEFASFYQAMGVEVHVVEMLERILPAEDAEISSMARKAFEKKGVHFHLQTTLEGVIKKDGMVHATVKDHKDRTKEIACNHVLLAVGIVGNTEGLGLEHAGVQTERGHIKIDDYCRTNTSHIFAIGDVVGAPWLAHKASHEGMMVADTIGGKKTHPLVRDNIPGCTYSMPQIASIGMSEERAKSYVHDKKDTLKIGRFPFAANGKALAMGEDFGMIKLLFSQNTGELLGAHMIGSEVTEMIHSMALCKTLEATEETIMHTIFPHPTLSEMIHESTLDAEDRAIHM